jgi:hypothetical protein
MLAGCSRATWYVAPEFGEKKAAKENRPILYYFKAWDSTQHRNMLRNVLHDSRVDKELQDTINIELEYGFFDEQADRFKVRKPQVCVFAAPDGSRITPNYYVNPVPTPEAFLQWLRDAKAEAAKREKPASSAGNTDERRPSPAPAPRHSSPVSKMQRTQSGA